MIAESYAAIVEVSLIPEIAQVIERANVLTGTQLMTTDGRDLGVIADLYFDERTGAVEGYEVSGGLFADAYSGRSFVPLPPSLKVGKRIAFVPPEMAALVEGRSNTGGVMQTADRRLPVNLDSDDLLVSVPIASTVEQTEGLRTQRAVRTAEGIYIAALGQIVTVPVIERARAYHKEQDLMAAVGLVAGESLEMTNPTRDRFKDGVSQAQGEAQSLWRQVKRTVSDFKTRSTQAMEASRIKEALGRPVNRVILDQHDNVILNVGELVTHQAIERSRQANMLDVLLESVDEQEPQILPIEQRAPVSGDASLEEQQQVPDTQDPHPRTGVAE